MMPEITLPKCIVVVAVTDYSTRRSPSIKSADAGYCWAQM